MQRHALAGDMQRKLRSIVYFQSVNEFHSQARVLCRWNIGKNSISPFWLWTDVNGIGSLGAQPDRKRVSCSTVKMKIWTLSPHKRIQLWIIECSDHTSHQSIRFEAVESVIQNLSFIRTIQCAIDSACYPNRHLWRDFNQATEIVYIWWNCGLVRFRVCFLFLCLCVYVCENC